jgi:hypothetical protein
MPGPTSVAFSSRNSPIGVRTVALSLLARSRMARITLEAVIRPALRRSDKPQAKPIIMNKSDFDAGAPVEDGRFFAKAFSSLISAWSSKLMSPQKPRFATLPTFDPNLSLLCMLAARQGCRRLDPLTLLLADY